MDDLFIIKQVQAGNKEAFRLIVLRYQRPIFKFLSTYPLSPQGREEVAQDGFLKAYRAIHSFDEKKSSFSSWLFLIVKRLALNEISKLPRRSELSVEEFEKMESIVQVPASLSLEILELTERVRSCLEKLPISFRNALVLSYLEELSLDEIAAIECVPIGTIKSRIYRGKNMLKLLLAQGEQSV